MKLSNVIVAGAGKSGIASANLLNRHGTDVILYDGNVNVDIKAIQSKFEFPEKVKFKLGEMTPQLLEGMDLFVISPGIPLDAPFMKIVSESGIPIWGEIELAYYFSKGIIAGITGTNGKTTTTTLVGEIFKAYRSDSMIVGNIGIPFTDLADKTKDDTLISAELSSFQLETVHTFRPHVAAVLNLTPDHLNRHYTFDNYVNAKLRITMNQTPDDYLVLNYDDPEIRKRKGSFGNARLIWFSRKEELPQGVYIKSGIIRIADGEDIISIIDTDDITIPGDHNVENVLAAAAVSYYMGVPASYIRDSIKAFKGVEHRIEFVREKDGVRFYNDSKGTNPDAAIKGILSMKGPTYLIGGGYDKQSDYGEWIDAFGGKVKKLILIGETKEKIAEACRSKGFEDYIFMDTLKDAVDYCGEKAVSGDMVLLSPACASWDMFKSYEERGDLFRKYVNEL